MYVVATPIGNLEDITLRALRILGEVDLILAEDTRVTRKLLSRYDIHTPLAAYHAHTPEGRTARYVEMLMAGSSIALVSDAGTPAISDPGDDIVARAVEVGAVVIPIPGPSAVLAAMSVSAIPGGRFAFDGFPPRGRSDRRAFFAGLRAEPRPVVLYEAPQRLISTLAALSEALGDRSVTIAREITKLHETVFRGALSAAMGHFASAAPRGEFTLVVHPDPEQRHPEADPCRLADHLRASIAEGASKAEAARRVAKATGVSRSEAYRELLRMDADG